MMYRNTLQKEKAIGEIDINPVLITEHGCVGLDALIVPKNITSVKDTSGGTSQYG